jgi:tetratricopeptide (TPR) repeat protein
MLDEFRKSLPKWIATQDWQSITRAADTLLLARLAPSARAFVLRQKAIALARLSESTVGQVLLCLREALKLAAADPEEHGKVLANLAAAYGVIGDYDTCATYVSALRALHGQFPTPDLTNALQNALFNLGLAYDRADRVEEAERTYEQLVNTATGSPAAWSANNLVGIYLRLGRLVKAARMLERAMGFGDPAISAMLLNHEALLHLATGDTRSARQKATEAMAMAEGNLRFAGEVALTVAHIEKVSGNYDEACRQAQHAMKLARSLPNGWLLHRVAKFMQSLTSKGVS